MTELDIYKPNAAVAVPATADLDGWVTVVQEVSRLASVICDTEFVPKNYRGNAAAATAAILTGRELGLPPMTALRHVQLVEGSATLSAEYKRARVLAAGHEFDVLEITTELCTVSGRRRGSHKPPTVITFTMQDARTAKLVKDRGAWTTRPRRMLFARAGTELCDFLFADVTNGLPTTELLAEDGDGVSGYDEQPAEATRPTGRVTAGEIIGGRAASATLAQRAAATQTASPAEPQTETADAPPPLAPSAGEAPPSEATYTDHDSPGTAVQPQLTAIWTLMTSVYSFTTEEKPKARAVCAHIIGHDLESTKDMSKNEARKVLDRLAEWRADADQRNEAPRAYLDALMATGTEAGDER
jgi:hypothetical protein